jgi:hypothetical protein
MYRAERLPGGDARVIADLIRDARVAGRGRALGGRLADARTSLREGLEQTIAWYRAAAPQASSARA